MPNLADPNALTFVRGSAKRVGRKKEDFSLYFGFRLEGYPTELAFEFNGVPESGARHWLAEGALYAILPYVAIGQTGDFKRLEDAKPIQTCEFYMRADSPACRALAAAAVADMPHDLTLTALRAVLAEHFQPCKTSADIAVSRVFDVVRAVMTVQGFVGTIKLAPYAVGMRVELEYAGPRLGGRQVPYNLEEGMRLGVTAVLDLYNFKPERVPAPRAGRGALMLTECKERALRVAPNPTDHIGSAAARFLAEELKRTPETHAKRLAELIDYAQKFGDEFRAFAAQQ